MRAEWATLKRGTMASVGARGVLLLAGLATSVVLARTLSRSHLGAYFLFMQAASVGLVVGLFGTSNLIQRFVPQLHGRAVRVLLARAGRNAGLAFAGFGVLLWLAWPSLVARLETPELLPLRGAVLAFTLAGTIEEAISCYFCTVRRVRLGAFLMGIPKQLHDGYRRFRAEAYARAAARYRAGEYEAAMHPNERTRSTYFAENFAPLAESGQLELVTGEQRIMAGVHFLPTPGHTEDHASVVLSSRGETAIYTGDLVHHEVQMERPAWIAAFDVLPLVSLETKKRLAERAIRERALLICVHNAYPGVGRLTEQDGRRVFVRE